MKKSDITGQRFGRLVAIKRVGNCQYPCGAKLSVWECKCDCGNTVNVTLSALRTGNTSSCGCYRLECAKENTAKHHLRRTRLYTVWQQMKKRCYNENDRVYKYYGKLGVTVCDEWKNNFVAFNEWAHANGYKDDAPRGECTIDRINPFGNYEPDNCRIVTQKIQLQNTRKDWIQNGYSSRQQREEESNSTYNKAI